MQKIREDLSLFSEQRAGWGTKQSSVLFLAAEFDYFFFPQNTVVYFINNV